MILLSPPSHTQCWGYKCIYGHPQLFMWVLGIRTHVLVGVWEALSTQRASSTVLDFSFVFMVHISITFSTASKIWKNISMFGGSVSFCFGLDRNVVPAAAWGQIRAWRAVGARGVCMRVGEETLKVSGANRVLGPCCTKWSFLLP